MKVSRFLCLFAMLAMVLAITPAVFAQDETFGLTAEDFQLLQDINANSAAADSFRFEIDTDLALTGLGDDVSASFTGSGAISDSGFQFSFDGEATTGGETTPVNLEIRLVDDSLYISADGGETWQGGTTEELTEQGTQMLGGLTGMAGMDSTASSDDMMSGLMENPAAMQALSSLSALDPSEFLSLARVPGDDVTFTLDFDIAGLLGSDAIAPLLGTAMSSAMGGAGTDSAATMTDAQMQQMQSMVQTLFGDTTFSITQTADGTTELVEATSIALNFPLSTMMTGGSEPGNIAFNLDIRLPEYNGAVAIEAPASFEPFDFSSMMMGAGA